MKNFKSMFEAEVGLQTYKESFNKAGDAFPLSELPSLYDNCISAKCVERDQVNSGGETFHSKSICLVMPMGDVKYIPCTRDSLLKNGDVVDKDSIMITPLERAGEIKFRADGLAIAE